ncbi:MAG TPA: hypothetical protein VHM92_00240 [Allosphingosinicella sp.]|nr:hypothetical protein [Allosphingosinicella sp.]
MIRVLLVSASLLLMPVAAVAPLHAKEKPAAGKCEEGKAKKRRNSLFGNVVGNVASNVVGRTGLGSIGGISLPTSTLLSEAILKLLDCKEQQQAANATNEAVRGGVGTTSSWESETRPGVAGSSSVTGQNRLADGAQCYTVTDVVIVDGEETRAEKRMCRKPGESAYVRV